MHIKYNRSVEVLIRKRTEEDAIDDAEDDCGSADAEGQGKDGDEGEAAIFSKIAERVVNVHEKVFKGWPPPDCAAVLFSQRYISKLAPSGGGGFFSGHAAGDQFFDLFFEMRLNLIGKIVVEAPTGK